MGYRVLSYNAWLKLLDPFPVEWTENTGRDGNEVMRANVALFSLLIWAQWSTDAHEEGDKEKEEYAELDNYDPE
jgi:hypothetical protein